MPIRPLAASPLAAANSSSAIEKVAHDFESMFVGQLLRAMPIESIAGKEAGAYGDLLLDQYGKLITDRGGIGVGRAIARELGALRKDDGA